MFEAASILTTLIAALGVSSLFNGRFAGSDVFPDCVQDGGRLQLLSGDHRYDRYGSLHPLQPPRKGPPPAGNGRAPECKRLSPRLLQLWAESQRLSGGCPRARQVRKESN